MTLSVSLILVIIALIFTAINAWHGKPPLWLAVLLVCIAMLV